MRKYEITARETDDDGINYSVSENAPFDSITIDEEDSTVHLYPADEKQHPEKSSTERILTDLRCLHRHVDGIVRTADITENLEVSISTVYKRFDGMHEARVAAGISTEQNKYSTERILTDLRCLHRHVDGPVKTADMRNSLEVSVTAVTDRFGGIQEARKAAGIPGVADRYSAERILTDLKGLNRCVDGVPRTADMRNHLEVSYSTVYNRFGSIWEARVAAGISPVGDKYSTERVVTDLRGLNRCVDGPVRTADIRDKLQYTLGDLQQLFGGIADARDAAGISTQPRYEIDNYTHTSTERILTDLRGLDRSIDGEPSLADMKQTLEVSPGILYERFGGISKAKETARTPAQSPDQPPDQPPDQTQYPTDRILTDLRGLDRHTDSEISSADIKETLEVSINLVYRRFQGIQEAKEAAGIPAQPHNQHHDRKQHATDRILTDLKGLDRYVDGIPSTTDMRAHLESSATTVATRFGSIQEGREAAGISAVPTQDQQSPTTQHNSDHPEATQQTR